MDQEDQYIYRALRDMVNENRLSLIERILEQRTRYITVVLEDIYQPHNASAVFRSCDGFGIQDIHVIENRNSLETIPDVELGSAQWLSIHSYKGEVNNTRDTLNKLKSRGYRIVATTPHTDERSLDEFDLSNGKAALLFGTEMKGLSETALSLADEYLRIPMRGFTESFNISVSVAVVLHYLRTALEKSDLEWQLTENEKIPIRYAWVRNSVKNLEIIEKELRKKLKS